MTFFNRKIIVAVVFLVTALLFSSCTASKPKDEIIKSLGEYDKREFYSEGAFQDFTDYAKYYYSSANIAENDHFTKIQESDLTKINEHLDDFEGWIETAEKRDASCEIVLNYDFNRAIIDTEDYIFIHSEKHTFDNGHTSLVNYNIYFFDTQTLVLYYFHNNM